MIGKFVNESSLMVRKTPHSFAHILSCLLCVSPAFVQLVFKSLVLMDIRFRMMDLMWKCRGLRGRRNLREEKQRGLLLSYLLPETTALCITDRET